MQAGTVISYSENPERPYAELMLHNGDRIQLSMDGAGVAIQRLEPGIPPAALFHADPDLTARICAALLGDETRPPPTPLRILVAAVAQLGSADEIRLAFEEAAAQAQ